MEYNTIQYNTCVRHLLEGFLEVSGVITDRGLGQNNFQHLKNALFSNASGAVLHEGRNEN
jgi:hypothetical protein